MLGSIEDWDRHCACFDKLSMRPFFGPLRFPLILSLSKDARRSSITVICDSPDPRLRQGESYPPYSAFGSTSTSAIVTSFPSRTARKKQVRRPVWQATPV